MQASDWASDAGANAHASETLLTARPIAQAGLSLDIGNVLLGRYNTLPAIRSLAERALSWRTGHSTCPQCGPKVQ